MAFININTREVADMMGIKHYKLLEKLEGTKDCKTKGIISILTDMCETTSEYFIRDNYKDLSGKSNKQYLCTIKGVKTILDNTRNYKNKKLLYEWYYRNTNQDVSPILYNREEIDFLNELSDVLKPFDIKCIQQYPVLSYKIDLYIEDMNIAIEYDEGGHANYTYKSEELRQKIIEREIGCKFIRVSNNVSIGENIGIIIKKLIHSDVC